MSFQETFITGLWIFEPDMFEDERGYFFESYNVNLFKDVGIDVNFVQDNESKSSFGVLRGLHYQTNPNEQAKLIRVTEGEIQDVVVDIRKDSPTYGKYFSMVLSAENRKQLFIPRGLAHGFLVLSESAVFAYKCDNFYSKEHETGIIYNDPVLNIEWKLDQSQLNLSEKDKQLPKFG